MTGAIFISDDLVLWRVGQGKRKFARSSKKAGNSKILNKEWSKSISTGNCLKNMFLRKSQNSEIMGHPSKIEKCERSQVFTDQVRQAIGSVICFLFVWAFVTMLKKLTGGCNSKNSKDRPSTNSKSNFEYPTFAPCLFRACNTYDVHSYMSPQLMRHQLKNFKMQTPTISKSDSN